MADPLNTTPAPSRIPDRQVRSAFESLEYAIHNLKSMAALMEMTVERTLLAPIGEIEEHVRNQAGLSSHRIILMNEDESDSIEYAIRHTYDLIRDLHTQYHAALKGRVA